MKLHQQLLLNLFIATIAITNVAGEEKFDLSEFISIGLDNNFALQIAKNRQEISNNNFTRGNAGFLPVVDLSARHAGSITNTTQSLSDGSSASSGGSLNTASNAGLNLGLTLYNGYRVQYTYQKLEELKNQGELSTRLAIERFIAQTASEYYNFIQQSRQLTNLSYAVSLSKERYRIDEERYLIGSGSRLQMMQSRVFLNADSSRLARQYEILRSSQIRLNELMGKEDFSTLFGAKDTVIIVSKNLSYDDILEGTLLENTSLLIAQSNQVISDYDKQIIASRTYPYVNFNTGYGYTLNSYQTGSLQNQQNLSMNYNLTVGFNLFDGYNRKREISNALIEIENRDLTFRQVLQEVKADLMQIFKAYENNLGILELEYENLETARENMDIAFERYRLGALAGIELREVQKSLLEAEERLLSIQYQTKLAEISLLLISGRIAEYL